jgi:hypothetical protein
MICFAFSRHACKCVWISLKGRLLSPPNTTVEKPVAYVCTDLEALHTSIVQMMQQDDNGHVHVHIHGYDYD